MSLVGSLNQYLEIPQKMLKQVQHDEERVNHCIPNCSFLIEKLIVEQFLIKPNPFGDFPVHRPQLTNQREEYAS